MLKSAVIEEKTFKNNELFGPRSMNDLDLWYLYSSHLVDCIYKPLFHKLQYGHGGHLSHETWTI